MKMMTNDYDEQPDELQQQPQPQQQPTLPLIYLPIELAEEISMYFNEWTAVDLLRVSRSFHSLFLPRVWIELRTFTNITDDEMKQDMLKKYGHFVRIIDFSSYITNALNFDWLPFVKHATYIDVIVDYDISVEMAEMLIRLIKQSKMLQKLELRFDEYDTPVKFDELAVAINELECIRRIPCDFGRIYNTDEEGGELGYVAGFAELLHPSKRSKLRLKMRFTTGFNEVAVQELAPYVVKIRADGNAVCTAFLVDKFFGARDNDGQLLAFPHFKELSMTSCCFKGEYSGVKSITASRFPQLQLLYLDAGSCDFLDQDELNENKYEKYNWKPEYSGYPHIIIPSQHWQCLTDLTIGIVSSSILMDIVDRNPQLQKLRVGSEYSDVPKVNDASRYNHDEFQLDTILNRLPYLTEFLIGRLNSRLVVSPAAIPATRQHGTNIIIGCQMSIAPSAAAYILQMPQLTELTFNECIFADVNEIIQLLQNSAATCGIKGFQWYPIKWNQALALAVTEKMPRLKWFTVRRFPEKHRAVFEAKYEFHC